MYQQSRHVCINNIRYTCIKFQKYQICMYQIPTILDMYESNSENVRYVCIKLDVYVLNAKEVRHVCIQ